MAIDDLDHLRILDDLAKRASAGPAEIRKAADDAFELIVDQIQKREGCDRSRAYYLATKDERARSMYAISLDRQEFENAIWSAVGR